MEEKYTKQTITKCSVSNNDQCLPQNVINTIDFKT